MENKIKTMCSKIDSFLERIASPRYLELDKLNYLKEVGITPTF